MGSNVYKISTMENSMKKGMKKSLNLSCNQYHEYPTTTDWHSSLVNFQEENIEEMHFYFVVLFQKKRRIIERLERFSKLSNQHDSKKAKRKGKQREPSAKRRKNDPWQSNSKKTL